VKQLLPVSTPQGDSGQLSFEAGDYFFDYARVEPPAAISLLMPVRRAQYRSAELHPIFQMNLPEGFMLEELRNRLAKNFALNPMMLLAIAGSQSAIGRVQVDPSGLLDRSVLAGSGKGERLSEILAWDGKDDLFKELVNKYIYRAGISGVQPKVLVPQEFDGEPRATAFTQDLIIKSGRREYPGLAANEFLCMSMAKEAGIEVPEFYLSKNKELFVMKRFDRGSRGERLGFEDMAALAGLSARQKYEKSYSFVARLVEAFTSPLHTQRSLHALFDMVALSCIVGNGDAHLKNFGLLYSDPTTEDCRLAPAYDIVNTTAYIPEDVLALELRGHKPFFAARQGLLDFAKDCRVADPRNRIQELILTAEFVLRREEEIVAGIPHVSRAIEHAIGLLKDAFVD
jgi:serine/threonine-protein kinase HipA